MAANTYSLLHRQLRKYLDEDLSSAPRLAPFLAAVDQAYCDYKSDHELLEHALQLSSKELSEANERLRIEAETGRHVIERLRILGNRINEELGYTQFKADDKTTLLEEVEILSSAFKQNLIAQQELRRAKNTADSIYRLIPCAIFTLDREGKITTWNRKAEEITGYTQAEVIGKTRELFAAQKFPDFDRNPEQRSRFGGSRRSILIKNGQRRTISRNAEVLLDDDGNKIGRIISFEDVTLREADQLEIKQYKEHLESLVQERTANLYEANEALHRQQEDLSKAKETAEQANRAKSSFLSVISHEIRTPLHGIVGLTELIEAKNPPPEIAELTGMILNESNHLSSLINTLLDHAKIEAGKLDLLMDPFDIHRVLYEIKSLMMSMLHSDTVDIEVRIGKNVPQWIMGDGMRITQILNNIAGNAIKFTHKGFVRLSADVLSIQGEKCVLEFAVEDSGVGIPADKVDAVFESFTQADSRISREYGGTGLGTTITRQLVKLMGGTVKLESTENVGTTFRVILPMQVAPVQKQTESTVAPPSEKKKDLQSRILVAEDNENARMLIRMHLEAAGCRVDVVNDGKEAVQRYAENKYDLVITDIQMPEMDGFDEAKSIRAQERPGDHVPILAMTANADTATRDRCNDCGMDEVLTKPLRRKPLLEAVQRWTSQDNPSSPSPKSTAAKDPVDSDLDPDVFSYEIALDEFAGQRSLLHQSLKQFMHASTHQLKLMRTAFEAGDADAVRKTAHKLRGAAANMTATRLQEVAETIETALVNGDELSTVEPLLADWENEKLILENHLNQIPSCSDIL